MQKQTELERLLSSPVFAIAPFVKTISIKAGTADELVSASPAMKKRELTPPHLDLSRRPNEPPMRLSMEAFFQFSFWIAEELEDLVALHGCSPQSNFGYDIPLPGDIAI